MLKYLQYLNWFTDSVQSWQKYQCNSSMKNKNPKYIGKHKEACQRNSDTNVKPAGIRKSYLKTELKQWNTLWWLENRQIGQWNRIKNSEINFYSYSQINIYICTQPTLTKSTKDESGEGIASSTSGSVENGPFSTFLCAKTPQMEKKKQKN